ncbi:MAG: hypothetical protein M0Q42_09200 [Xanthomonadales bacterium]|nr:hypothetical protein [Xanthomonadales bacterium]
MKQQAFVVDDIRYLWTVAQCHGIWFCLHDLDSKVRLLTAEEKPWEWEWDGYVQSVELTGRALRPRRVFDKVAELTVAWVASTRPGFFYFRANDCRKTRIYHHLIRRWLQRLPVPYGMHEHNHDFYFYRLDRQAGGAG